ncbi:UDP-N-acetylglucosamine 4,6-dehydratase family protein [Niallia sp. FSL M8-0099]|uniref:UDP-N-acetylglucosamine 4,6-dehydratase family protein n=1 Tax=Niallia sp. FSL M8-0099 TaxID=2954519 RepID=UPI0030FA24BA
MYNNLYFKKKILIIGGTGTIGKHLLMELLKCDPEVVRIFSRDEYKQFELQQEMGNRANIRYLIGDVRDQQRLLMAMEDIDYVFHLAAMKHVPACEYNPFEAVKTNVIGTQNVIQAALDAGVDRVLFTSTDKAIAPTNAYGATKLTAERLISAANYQKGPKNTIFSSVRFGNVMGSRGSVIPLFKKQIIEKGYVTVTNKEMLRYMMTPKQAISLMLKANSIAYGGEVFVLKMPVIRLQDLVEIIVEEMEQQYNSHRIDIKEIGLRPGEKMYEELMTEDEGRVALETEDMFIIRPPYGATDGEYPNLITPTYEKINPNEEEVISKDTLKTWIREENLL